MIEISAAEFEALELRVLDQMCEDFRQRRNQRLAPQLFDSRFAITDPIVAERLFDRLRGIGAIETEPKVEPGEFEGDPNARTHYVISPRIVEITAARKAEIKVRDAPKDRVSAAWKWARSSWFAPILIVMLVAGFLVTAINQAIELLKQMGLVK